jgi:hypothetical protein
MARSGALTAAWRRGDLGPAVELAAALVRSRRDPAGLPIIHDAERFFERDFDAVLECAGHQAVRDHGIRCIETGGVRRTRRCRSPLPGFPEPLTLAAPDGVEACRSSAEQHCGPRGLRAQAATCDLHLCIDDQAGLNIEQLRSRIRRHTRRQGPERAIGWNSRRRTISKPSSVLAGRHELSTRPKVFLSRSSATSPLGRSGGAPGRAARQPPPHRLAGRSRPPGAAHDRRWLPPEGCRGRGGRSPRAGMARAYGRSSRPLVYAGRRVDACRGRGDEQQLGRSDGASSCLPVAPALP